MHTIVPHLWFDKEAKEATAFYTSVFSNSRITQTSVITGTPSGDCDIVTFELRGQTFMAINAGPYFKFNPSISFMVNFDPSRDKNARESLDAAWKKLETGGKVLMPLDEYPFSKRYGWVQDRFGLSWQLILTDPEGEARPDIVPSLMFVGELCGKAEEAMKFYVSQFEDSKLGVLHRYGPGQEPDKEGTVTFADFKLRDLWFAIMDSARQHDFTFNEAVSFIVHCKDQAEIDRYWKRLSAVPESEQCGWLKDKYGVSWQIVPTAMNDMLATKDQAALDRVTQAFLKMKKFDLAELQRAFEGK
jgi:predicted 3-demethylubiquinone-9 3-methyltransferase (glyoxalase superfamily)